MALIFTLAGFALTALGVWLQLSGSKTTEALVRSQRSESKTTEALVKCGENLSMCQSSCNVWMVALLVLVVVAFAVGRCSVRA